MDTTFIGSTYKIFIMFRVVPKKKPQALFSVPAKTNPPCIFGKQKIVNLQSCRIALFALDCLTSRSFNRSGTDRIG